MEIVSQLDKYNLEESYDEAIELFDNYLKQNPNDKNIEFLYALYLQGLPFDDYPSSLKILQNMKVEGELYEKKILLTAYIEETFLGEISAETISRIESLLSLETQFTDCFLYLKACYYKDKDENVFKNNLEAASSLNNGFTRIHELSSEYYLEKGIFLRAKMEQQFAIDSVTRIYKEDEYISPFDFSEFVEEHLKGTHASKVNFEDMISKLNYITSCEKNV